MILKFLKFQSFEAAGLLLACGAACDLLSFKFTARLKGTARKFYSSQAALILKFRRKAGRFQFNSPTALNF